MNPFQTIKDSSIWHDADNMATHHKKDPYVRIGVVLKGMVDADSTEPKYLVEVKDRGDTIVMWCRVATRFGGAYNYEDYTLRGYTSSPLAAVLDSFAAKAGDFVICVPLAGETREGVILGGLKHPSRKMELDPDDGPALTREFNGIKEEINSDGEYTMTFQGIPVNQDLLDAPQAAPIIPPIYDPTISGSFWKFDSEGGWEVNDAAVIFPQSIKIDKSGGTITITAGEAEFSIDKASQEFSITGNKLTIDSQLSIEATTLEWSVDATESIKMKALKIAIGSDGVELFDQLVQLIDAVGQVQVTSPVGPCTPIMATPQWVNIEMIKAKLTAIKGSL